jgi:Domain of unknown function (DUF5069)
MKNTAPRSPPHLNQREKHTNCLLMATVALRSPSQKVDGLFYFGRMLDKIRLHARGELPPDYHENLGKGFDEKCVTFLQIDYDQLVEHVKRGGSDEEILQWCFSVGRKPSENELYIWNEFMRKRGWNDEVSGTLKRRKQEAGMSERSDIETAFQFIDADEGRLPKPDGG